MHLAARPSVRMEDRLWVREEKQKQNKSVEAEEAMHCEDAEKKKTKIVHMSSTKEKQQRKKKLV